MASSNNRKRSYEEPDVTIIVGTQEFHEYSRELCCWSDYFHAALNRSGMQESRSMHFEFPQRDPAQWELIRSLVKPFSPTKVTLDNVGVALDWFDELLCKGGKEECDRVLKSDVLSTLHPQKQTTRDKEIMKENLDHFLQTLSISVQYGLQETKDSCIATLLRVLEEVPEAIKEEHLGMIVSFMDSDEDCESLFWTPLSKFVPESLLTTTSNDNNHKKDLIRNPCLPALILSQIQVDLGKRRQKKLFEIGACFGGNTFRKRVMDQSLLRDAAPAHWQDQQSS